MSLEELSNGSMTKTAPPRAEFGQDIDYFEGDKVIDLKELWASVYRNRIWIAGIILGCLALGLIVTLLMTPKYRATAAVQIDQEARKVLGTEQTDASASIQDAERFLKTQVDVISSRAVSRTVAQELRLFDTDRFLQIMGEEGKAKATPQVSLIEAKREKVLEVLRAELSVDLPPDSRIVRIGFTTPDPILSARIANSFADNYIKSNLQRKFDSTAYARDFLRGQLNESQQRLAAAERDAIKYASRTRIIDPSGGLDSSGRPVAAKTLTTATLVALSSQLAEATAKRIATEQRWGRFRKTALLTQPEVLNNDAIQNLLRQRAELRAALEEESERRRAEFPSIRQSQAKIDEINRQINAIATNITMSVRSEYDVARANEGALGEQVSQLKNSTFDEQNQSIQLSILRREADTFRQQYEYLLRRFNELNAESGVQANNIMLVDKAATPIKPSSPRLILNLLFASLGGLALSGIFVFARQNFFDTIRTPQDLDRLSPLPVVGVIPKIPENLDPVAELDDPKQPLSEAFGSLRSALMLASSNGFPTSMAFVSTGASEGKSMACYAIAQGLGRTGRKVLVIDLDLRRPNQHNYMGEKNASGMSDVLSGNRAIKDALLETKIKNVWFVPAGAIPPNPSELLEPQVLGPIIDWATGHFDVVLVDSAPVLGLADAIMIGSSVDGVTYLVESGRNLPKAVSGAIARLEQANVRIFGCVLTKFDAKQAGYGLAYESTYSYDYKS
jgi:polysaccharide biosynthesis transport protein